MARPVERPNTRPYHVLLNQREERMLDFLCRRLGEASRAALLRRLLVQTYDRERVRGRRVA